ncbi:MAG: hypothetical protein ACREMU_08165, partial [Gemmatimonadaceae bacterium]
MMRNRLSLLALSTICVASACTRHAEAADAHAAHDAMSSTAAAPDAARDAARQAADLPAGSADAESRLAKSPRHGEYAMIKVGSDSVRAWVVYPQVSKKAPVIVVV